MKPSLYKKNKSNVNPIIEDLNSQAPSEVVSFGCRLNAYEADIIKQKANDQQLKNTFIINTCAVTGEAVKEAKRMIRKLYRDHPRKKIIVTGCAAQINPDSFVNMPEVSCVIGNHDKLKSSTYDLKQIQINQKNRVRDILNITEISHEIPINQPRARAYVQIQNGCDHRCTFCIIPYGRGPSRSVPAGEIVRQINLLVNRGYKEIILSGIDLSSWGQDLPGIPVLGDLVRRILKLIPDLKRLRLSSIDAAEIDPVLFDLFANEKRLMPYLHLSLQAGDNLILKRMKRRHLREDAIKLCQNLRKIRPDISFGADLIAGFPTETETHFQNSLALIDECGLQFLHVFPYSIREGTPAARMPQNPKSIIKERAFLLREKGRDMCLKHFKTYLGKTISLLLEKENFGRAEDFSPVKISTEKILKKGELYQAKITGYTEKNLIAEIIL